MHEKIYTIPVNIAFEQNCDCPFCLLYKQLENTEIELITGASMMEPDVRIQTNKSGFCKEHYKKMYESQKRLSLALTLQTHIDELKKDISLGGFLSKDAAAKPIKRIEVLEKDCYVCNRINGNFEKMIETACLLFEEEREFRDHFTAQTRFCLPHYAQLLSVAKRTLSKRYYPELVKESDLIITKYISSLYDDVSLFCKKFDYNYRDEPWGTAKDSVERAIAFLVGGLT
ncbi:MAG: DUF6062 family protein [Clostridia bacterium]